jgi:hypothetical protein
MPPKNNPRNDTEVKVVDVTHTRTAALSAVINKKLPMSKGYGKKRVLVPDSTDKFKQRLEQEVAGVSGAIRDGTRFFDLWTRMLEQHYSWIIPDDHPWGRMIYQAFTAMRDVTDIADKNEPVLLYKQALEKWYIITSGLEQHSFLPQTIMYDVCAYHTTQLCNYVKLALPRHVLRALQYIYPDHRATFKRILIQRAKPGTVALPQTEYDALPEDAKADIVEGLRIADAQYSDAMLSAAMNLRWKLLCTMTNVFRSQNVRQRKNRNNDLVDILPKWFTLVPYGRKAARFITVDNRVARLLVGLPREVTVNDPVELTEPTTLDVVFGSSNLVKQWQKRKAGPLHFPATIKTNGVEVHFPLVEKVTVSKEKSTKEVQKTLAKHKDARSADAANFQHQVLSGGHGCFALDAADGLPSTIDATNVVGVDPGVKYLVYTSTGKFISRKDMYGPNRKWTVHSSNVFRATRQNILPVHIDAAQNALAADPLQGPVNMLVRNLLVWATHSKALQQFWGSRTLRSRRLVQSAQKRRVMDGVVNLVAPDPRTIVVFGANYNGRCCKFGDVAGPVCVKGICRKLAQHRVVVMVDEYNTTKMHSVCGQLLEADPADATQHERVCRHCAGPDCIPVKVKRDGNAASNIASVWSYYVDPANASMFGSARRPVHLRRPATVPAPVIVHEL